MNLLKAELTRSLPRSMSKREPKELLVASKEYASEYRWLSWWHLWSTLAVIAVLITAAVSALPWGVRIASSIVAGLVGVRMFIVYHDFQHSAILRGSPIAKFLMWCYGMLVLAPPSVWNHSHDQHHKSNSQTFSENVGSYPIMTTHAYTNALRGKRLAYVVSRHPLTMGLGYFTVFIWRMSLQPFLLDPRRHFDGGLAVVLHFALIAFLWPLGLDIVALGLIVPLVIASALGAYLFYAQHNYPTAELMPQSEWSHVDAALHSSSFIRMSPLMNWFTGNIGYHHVHHLNARIPFYRLPEAMAGLTELQSPGTTSLRPRDVVACLRLKLWSPEDGRFVGYDGV